MDESTEPVPRLAVLLFTDLVGSTALKQQVGDIEYRRFLIRHNELFEAGLAESEGWQIIKHTGDGYFVRFDASSQAVRFALRFQSRMMLEPWAIRPSRPDWGFTSARLCPSARPALEHTGLKRPRITRAPAPMSEN